MNIQLIIGAVVLTVVLLMGGTIKYLHWQNGNLTTELVVKQATIDTQHNTILTIQEDVKNLQRDNNEYQKQNAEIDSKFRETQSKLDVFRNRQATIYKKPKLVEKLINKSYIEFGARFSCNTGAAEQCKQSK